MIDAVSGDETSVDTGLSRTVSDHRGIGPPADQFPPYKFHKPLRPWMPGGSVTTGGGSCGAEGLAARRAAGPGRRRRRGRHRGRRRRRAGVRRVFIGLENINPANLMSAKKRQNKITEYRKMLLAWKGQGIITFAGYILGFPADTPETIRRDIAIIQNELPIDMLEFFCLTPLPGSEDHQTLWRKGVAMDPDLNNYDTEHACTGHARMSKEQWQQVYRDAWKRYYTIEHVETVLRRARASHRATP